MGHSDLDMVAKAEDGLAHFRDAVNARLAAAHQMLYRELIGCWMKSPASMVQTPGFAQNGHDVAYVIRDHFAGPSGEKHEAEMLRIIADAARGQDVKQRALFLMDQIAIAHADFHAEDAM